MSINKIRQLPRIYTVHAKPLEERLPLLLAACGVQPATFNRVSTLLLNQVSSPDLLRSLPDAPAPACLLKSGAGLLNYCVVVRTSMTDQASALVLAWLTGFAEINKGLPRTKYLDDSLDRNVVLAARRALAALLRGGAPIEPVILDGLANLIDPEDVRTCASGKPTALSRQREFVIRFRSQRRRSDGLVEAAIVNAVYEDIYVGQKSRETAVASVSSRFNVSEDDAAQVWDKFRWSQNTVQNPHTGRRP